MKLRNKLLAIILSIILICGFTIIFFVKNTMSEAIMNEFKTKGTTITRNIAVQSEDLILTENILQLHRLITTTKNSEPEVEYIFITSPDNKVIVHTFEGGFPVDLLNANRLFNSSSNIVSLKSEHGIIRDFAYPVMKGEIATVRLGMSEDHIIKIIDNTIFETIKIILMIMVSGIIVALVMGHYMVRPLTELRNAVMEIGKGHLDTQILVKSKDEVGELGLAFNKMAEELKKSNEEILSAKEYTDNIVYSMAESLIVLSPDGVIKTVNNSTTSILEYGKEELIGQPMTKVLLDGEQFVLDLIKGIEETAKTNIPKQSELVYISKSSKKIPILFSGSVMYDKQGNVTGILCVSLEITERKIAQDNMRKSLEEKEVLLREIHHRVKNNMQIISSLLRLQSENIEDKKYRDAFIDSQNRIHAMALIHEKLYQSKSIAKINFKEYIDSIVSNIFESYCIKSNIKIDINIENIPLIIDCAVPCGLIINELVTNSLKYAFPDGRQGKIQISVKSNNDHMIQLSISDDGIGIPEDMDIRNTKSLGLHLVTALAEKQLNGEFILNRENGTEFQIKFRYA